MQKHDVHICLVSDQPLPNLIPVLDPSWRPRQVILLVTPAMETKARQISLKASLEAVGCEVIIKPFNAFLIEDIRRLLIETLAGISGRDVALNLTGGTKIMALGAYEVFRELGLPAFYVDTFNGQLIEIYPQAQTSPLPDLVKTHHYLNAYGYSVTSRSSHQVAPELQKVSNTLVSHLRRYEKAIGKMNFYASEAENGLSVTIDEKDLNYPRLREILDLFAESGVLTVSGTKVIFRDEKARFFTNGGWLETYVLRVLNQLKGEKVIRDHAASLEVMSKANSKNELDLAFTARNRLHLIECKTSRMKGPGQNNADITYKLETLTDLIGGTFGKAMLVSYRPLREADRIRCKEYDIQVVEGEQIAGLHGYIQDWILR